MQSSHCRPAAFPPEFWEFISKHRNEDVAKLRLKFHGKGETWTDCAITHIECLKKCGKKFGDMQPRLMLSALSVEQATSGNVALLHGELAKRVVGQAESILDMTCGMGIDLRAIRNALGCHALGIELNQELAAATAYNFSDCSNVEILCDDSVQWLERYDGVKFDLVFIDPARRGDGGQRVFNIHHCQPDISELLPVLERKCRFVMVKLSPMLDVTQTLRDLPQAVELHLIDEGGECREILVILDMSSSRQGGSPLISIHSGDATLTFRLEDERAQSCAYESRTNGRWLFEPSPATMKAQPFGILCGLYNMTKLHPNTHLFCCDAPVAGLPGKWYEIEFETEMSVSVLKTLGKQIGGKADVAVRNFPLKADELQKRLKLKPGGSCRLMGATVLESGNMEKRMLFVLKKASAL